MPQRPHGRAWFFVELLLWAVGVACLGAWIAHGTVQEAGRRAAVQQFAKLRLPAGTPDQHLWSPERITAWLAAMKKPSPPPLGVLRVPKLGLEVAILEGTDDAILDRAVGHVEDTAAPGAGGNCAIAGHRDGFFRVLQQLGPGDVIEIETVRTVTRYRVERTWVVQPEEVSVLDPTPVASVTLVTCYPFYFVGSAPQRFIVRAVQLTS
ncbi:MAG TPA: class D sortase [Vicinamibacterales bacterium]|jgi:sortase A|nr:class D sortase [Vicinamibacterales bacterium]